MQAAKKAAAAPKTAPSKTITAQTASKTAPKAASKTARKTGSAKASTRTAVRRTGAASKATAPARRARAVAPAKRTQTPAALLNPRGPQRFNVSHLNEVDFRADGLRPYAQYRDLGIAAATGGLCQAHVIRLIPPCTDEVRKRHLHTVDLQLVYVLKGWIKNEFEGEGEQMMSAGSCWLQPSGVKHTVLDYSADCEVLEIIVPADFETADLA